MPLQINHLKLYGSAVMPDTDGTTNIGGAVDKTKKVDFTDFGGAMQAVSSTSTDTVRSIEVFYRDSTGVLLSETKTLTGTTPIAYTATPERVLKGVKSGSTNGDVAVEKTSAERTGTAGVGSTTNTIILDAGASAIDGFYNGLILRLTATGYIREVIDYVGGSKKATVSDFWPVGFNPDSAAFRLSKGFFFDKTPNEVLEVRRPFYDSTANPPGGGAVDYYDKVFYNNSTTGTALLTAQVLEAADPSGKITFGLDTAVNSTSSNGAGNNRKVSPGGITFDNSAKNVPGGTLNPGSSIGVWLKLSLLDGDFSQNTTETLQLTGTST